MKEEATCFFFPLELFSTFKTSWDRGKKKKTTKLGGTIFSLQQPMNDLQLSTKKLFPAILL